MSKYHTQLLNKLRANTKASQNAYYLFFLGTDVNFVSKPELPNEQGVAPYIRGETFSFIARATAKLLGETGQELPEHTQPQHENYAHSYHADSIDVINGPNTLGNEAGDRIAKGLLLTLQAIANGQTEINFSGFSRGAVEAIVLTNELKRVRDALQADSQTLTAKRTLVDILQDTYSVPSWLGSSYTKNALTKLLDPTVIADDEELKAALLSGLQQINVNLFALDPVPGGNFKKIPVGWDEPSFYELPDFVHKKLELVQQHETSNCFKAIIPKNMPYEVIPGCHGTGDGNQFDDTGGIISAEKTDVSGVQDLVIRRWLEFMSLSIERKHASQFNELVAEHDALNAVAFAYLVANAQERDKLLLQSYQKIQENYPAFVFLAGRNYAGLGQFLPTRHIHYHKHGSIPISDLHPHGNDHFVNTQHVKLWISQHLNEFNFFEKSLAEQISWIRNNITYVFKEVAQTGGLGDDDVSAGQDLVQNELQKIMAMVANKQQSNLLIEAFATLSNTLILTYLRNHLNEQQLIACHEYFAEIIEVLKQAIEQSNERSELAKQFTEVIQKGLTTNLHQHSHALLTQTQRSFADSKALLHIATAKELQQSLGLLSSEETLEQELSANEQKVLQLKQIRKQQKYSWLTNTQRLVSELNSLSYQIDILAPFCDAKDLLKGLQALTNTPSLEAEDSIAQTALLQKLHLIINQSLIVLKAQAAELIKSEPDFLANKPEELEEAFFQEVRLLAQKEQIAQHNQELQSAIVELGLEKKNLHELLQQEQSGHKNTLEQLKDTCQRLLETQTLNEHLQHIQQEQNAKAMQLQQSLHEAETTYTSLVEEYVQFQAKNNQELKEVQEALQLVKAENVHLQEQAKDVQQENTLATKKLQEEVQRAKEEGSKLQQQLEVLEEAKKQEAERLENSLYTIEQQYIELKQQLEIIQQEKNECIDRLTQEVKEAHQQIQIMQQQIIELEAGKTNTIDGLERELENLQTQYVQFQENSRQAEQEYGLRLQELQRELSEINEERTELHRQVRQLANEKDDILNELQILKEQLTEQQNENTRLKDEMQQITAERLALAQELKKWQRLEEQHALIKINQLHQMTADYLQHLQAQKSDSPLLTQKKDGVGKLKNILEKLDVLPSERLEQFQTELDTINQQIKEHRDSQWLRFARDCLRMIALMVTGLALYRAATGHAVHFFRPSAGEEFVEKVENMNNITSLP